MKFIDLCKAANIEEKELENLIYKSKDPMVIKENIIKKYNINLNGKELLELLESTPIRIIKIIPQED